MHRVLQLADRVQIKFSEKTYDANQLRPRERKLPLLLFFNYGPLPDPPCHVLTTASSSPAWLGTTTAPPSWTSEASHSLDIGVLSAPQGPPQEGKGGVTSSVSSFLTDSL